MKKLVVAIVTAAFGLAVASTALAQGRHDDKHGKGKPSAAPDTSVADRTPGRHDQRPHGMPKKKAEKKGDTKAQSKADTPQETKK